MNGAGGAGKPTGRNRATPLSEHTGGASRLQRLAPHNAGGGEHEPNDADFGSLNQDAGVMRDALSQLSSHQDIQQAQRTDGAVTQILRNHTDEMDILDNHQNLPASSSGEYKLEEGTYLGLHIVAYKLMISDALQNTKGYPVLYEFYQGLALVVCDLEWVQAGGYSDKERAEIKVAQIKMIKKDWEKIVKDCQGMNPVNVSQYFLDRYAVPMVPAKNLLQGVDRMVKSYDHSSKMMDHDALVSQLVAYDNRSDGSGFFGLSQDFQKVAFYEYLQEHSVVRADIEVAPNHFRVAYKADFSDNPSNEEFAAREVAACIRNGIVNANGIEQYFMTERAESYKDTDIRQIMESAIQKAVAEEFIVSPYVPKNNSRMKPKEVLAEELKVCRFNMPAKDQHSPREVMKYLEIHRGILHHVKVMGSAGVMRNITEEEFHDFIREAIDDRRLDLYEASIDSKMSAEKILEEEFRAAQFNMLEKDRKSASKVMKYLEEKGIYNVQAKKAGGGTQNIQPKDLYDFIEQAIAEDWLAPYNPTHKSSMSPEKILEEEIRAAWFNMQEEDGDRYSSNAVMKYLKEKRKILEVKATRVVGEEATVITEREIDNFIEKSIAEKRLNPYKPDYDSSMSPEGILAEEFRKILLHIPVDYKRDVGVFFSYLKKYRDFSDVQATRPGEVGARNITEREIYAYINKLMAEGTFDQLPSYNEMTPIGEIFEQELLMYWLNTSENAGADYNTVEAFKEHLVGRNILNIKGVKVENGESEKISQAEVDVFLGELVRYNVMPAGAPAGGNATPQPGASPVPGGAAVPDVVPQADVLPAAVGMPGAVPVAGAGVPRQAVVRPEVLVELQEDWIDAGQGTYSKQKEDAFRIMTDVEATDEEFEAFFAELKRLGNVGA